MPLLKAGERRGKSSSTANAGKKNSTEPSDILLLSTYMVVVCRYRSIIKT
jgi:hypothetical protein